MTRPLILLATLALTACTAPELSSRADHTITRDAGGAIADYAARADRMRQTGARVVIDGVCASACAMLASLPTACVTRRGKIGLHYPILMLNGKPFAPADPAQYFARLTPAMAQAVQARGYDWGNPMALTVTVTHETAPQYGVARCQP
jgi:hypothetical protein